MAVCNPLRLVAGKAEFTAAGVNHYEVVSGTVHLVEFEGHAGQDPDG